MKSIIRLSSLLLCWVVATAMLLAQPPHREARPPLGQLIEQHAAALELSDEQIAELTELDAMTRTRLDELRQNESLEPDARRKAAREVMEQTKAGVATILTEDQQQQLRQLMAAQREARRPDPAEREAMRARKEALHTAVKTYRAENVEPVLRTQRQELDTRISAADRATLAEIRTQLAATKAEMTAAKKALMEERRNTPREERTPDREATKTAFAELREQHRATHENLKASLEPLLATYDADITELLAEIAEEQATWKADLQAIHEQYAPEGEAKPHDRRQRGKEHRPHRGKDHGEGHEGRKEGMGKARFLLMDPAATEAPAAAATTPAALNTLSLFPNPTVSGETRITLRMAQAGPARVELRTENGRVLRVIADSKYTAGEHTLTVTTQGLRPGIYYLSLSDAAGTRSERMVVN